MVGAAEWPATLRGILQFVVSPFASEDLRSVLVSHLHNKGGTDWGCLPETAQVCEGCAVQEGRGEQGLLCEAAHQQAPCLAPGFPGHPALAGWCPAVASLGCSKETRAVVLLLKSPAREDLVSWHLTCSQGPKWIPVTGSHHDSTWEPEGVSARSFPELLAKEL